MVLIATTTVSVYHVTRDEPDEPPVRTPAYQSVEANISNAAGQATPSRVQIDRLLHVDLTVNVVHGDVVLDEQTGEEWQVLWAETNQGMGLDVRLAGMVRVEGSG